MLAPLLLVLALTVAQSLLPASLRYLVGEGTLGERLRVALGPRDTQPALGPSAARAARALRNLQESLPLFLTLALLLERRAPESPLALRAAWVFLVARSLYVPAYLAGIPGLRSAVWSVSFGALGAMLAALLQTVPPR